ncbi:MAG: chemotaxis protein, partial [Rhodospirillales bacterium]|nr:chemotaxis protein [Rhodospirillales bacterium]
EAARAGEAGKGFAVVASEVKNLANQTARATEDISSQISAIQDATTGAVDAIQGIGKTIDQVNEIAGTIAAAVEQQGAATNEISRNVQEAATGTQQVSQNIQSVSQAANEAGQGASEVLSAAEELSKQSEVLGNEVDKFLENIKKI